MGKILRRPSAYAVIRDAQDRVVCVRTEHGLFLPGGGLDPGEAPREGVVREVREECGLDAAVVRELWAFDEEVVARDGSGRFLIQSVFYECRVVNETVHPSEEDHVHEWVERETAAGEMLREGHRRVLVMATP
jgi:8-oxo-dGTP diphosphatase